MLRILPDFFAPPFRTGDRFLVYGHVEVELGGRTVTGVLKFPGLTAEEAEKVQTILGRMVLSPHSLD